MDRRNFIQLGFAGIGSTIVAPRLVIASASEKWLYPDFPTSELR